MDANKGSTCGVESICPEIEEIEDEFMKSRRSRMETRAEVHVELSHGLNIF